MIHRRMPFRRGAWKGKQGRSTSRGGCARGRGGEEESGERNGRMHYRLDSQSISELDAGITEYMNSAPAFTGILKHRFSDFNVREVALDGRVARLNNVKVPQIAKTRSSRQLAATVRSYLPFQLPSALFHAFVSLLGIVQARSDPKLELGLEEISKLVSPDIAKKLSRYITSTKPQAFVFPVSVDKEARTALHATIRNHFSAYLISDSTIVDGDARAVRVCRTHDRLKKRRRGEDSFDPRGSQVAWPPGKPDYVTFVLTKRNKDTNAAFGDLAKFLRVNRKEFSYAGTKDKRAVTSQWCSVYRTSPQRLYEINRPTHPLYGSMRIGNVGYSKQPLSLGDLLGNEFSIVIRGLSADEHVVSSAATELQRSGFVNYFGLQRFGSTKISTHLVGRALLRQEWAAAVHLVLSARNNGDDALGRGLKEWIDRKDAKKALEMVPSWAQPEHAVLEGLAASGNTAFRNGLDRIPVKLITMYTHAYQSFVWNTVVSFRLRELGKDVCVGDLVLDSNGAITADIVEIDDLHPEDEFEQNNSKRLKKARPETKVHVVSQEDIESGKFSIYDVVLPMPGFDIEYPHNEAGAKIKELLRKDGIEFDKMKDYVQPEFMLPGAYRYMVKRVQDMEWSVKRCNDDTLPLVKSDLDLLEDRSPVGTVADGAHSALCLKFRLDSSCYATMVIRELLKQDTSTRIHSKLSASLLPAVEAGERIQALGSSINPAINSYSTTSI